jgi:hypothetical protein
MTSDKRPLVLHGKYRFDTGGLENGIVNLINHMPADAYRHAVLALAEIMDFMQRFNLPTFEVKVPARDAVLPVRIRDVTLVSIRQHPRIVMDRGYSKLTTDTGRL